MDFLRMINGVIPSISCCMGLKRSWPPGVPKDACWIFPGFWNLLSESFSCFSMDLIVFQISFYFLEVVGWYSLFHI